MYARPASVAAVWLQCGCSVAAVWLQCGCSGCWARCCSQVRQAGDTHLPRLPARLFSAQEPSYVCENFDLP